MWVRVPPSVPFDMGTSYVYNPFSLISVRTPLYFLVLHIIKFHHKNGGAIMSINFRKRIISEFLVVLLSFINLCCIFKFVFNDTYIYEKASVWIIGWFVGYLIGEEVFNYLKRCKKLTLFIAFLFFIFTVILIYAIVALILALLLKHEYWIMLASFFTLSYFFSFVFHVVVT